jgi:hypothetical protein
MRNSKLPHMEKRILFERTRSLWPDAVCHLNPSGTREALCNVYRRIEEQRGGQSDNLMELAAWAFHQAISELAMIKPPAPRAALRRHEISFEAFDWWLSANLTDLSWTEFRSAYLAARG